MSSFNFTIDLSPVEVKKTANDLSLQEQWNMSSFESGYKNGLKFSQF